MWRKDAAELKQAVILAGGQGTRLRSRLGSKPKPLAEIGGVPLLGHQLQLLRKHRFTDVVLLVNYGAEQIHKYCQTFDAYELHITIIDDGEPRGTAGAVLRAVPRLASEFIVLYADTMLDVDLTHFWDWHSRIGNAAASLLLHPNAHPQDSDLVEIDAQNRILRFHPYPRASNYWVPNLVNAALYIIRSAALPKHEDSGPPLDFARDLFPRMLESGALLKGYLSPEYIKDVGTPERLDTVNRDFSTGAMGRASLSFPKPAVFVDRDGTLNEEKGHISSATDLVVFDFVGAALRRLNQAGQPAIVLTNQPVLARGEASYGEIQRIHGKLDAEVGRVGAYFDRVYLCPHHPHRGFPGEIPELKVTCHCRKPAPGMIYQAQRDFNLKLCECWFIGDSDADIGAAAAAKVTSILVRTGLGANNGKQAWRSDFVTRDFAAAIDFILDVYPVLSRACHPILDRIEPGSDWFVAGFSDSARQSIAATLKRELHRRGKSANVQHLEQARSLDESDLCVSRRPSAADTVILWEGSRALDLSRELGMLHHSIWVQDSNGSEQELSEASCAVYTVDLQVILSPNQNSEGLAA